MSFMENMNLAILSLPLNKGTIMLFRHIIYLNLILSTLLFTAQTSAHGRYVLPSHTILSGSETKVITLQASISNDVFHADMPFGNNLGGVSLSPKLQGVFKLLQSQVIEPDGATIQALPFRAYARYSVADLSLTKNGTYKINIEQKPFIITSFNKSDGSKGRIFGGSENPPEDADNIIRHKISSRTQAFISFNGISQQTFTQKNGLQLRGESHPNDLFNNEDIHFQLHFNGQALNQALTVKITKEGTRHRNQREELIVTTKENGEFNFKLMQAGFYLLEAEIIKDSKLDGIDKEHDSLYLTVEVFPQ